MISTVKEKILNVSQGLTSHFLLCTVLCFVAFMLNSRYKRKQMDWKSLPGFKISDLHKVMLLTNLLKSDIPNKNIMLFQIFCGYAHLFRKEGMCLLVHHFNPVVFVYKAETIEPVLAGSKHLRKGVEAYFLRQYMRDGFIVSPNLDKWRHMRKLSLPAFRLLDNLIFTVGEKADLLTEKIATAMKSEQFVDIASMMEICILSIFCEIVLGSKVQENDLHAFAHAFSKYKTYAISRAWHPLRWMDVTYAKTKEGKECKRCIQIMEEFMRKMIIENKQKKLSQMEINLKNMLRKDYDQVSTEIEGTEGNNITFLDIWVDHHLKNENFTLENVLEEVNNFVIAGVDTVPANASWAIYLLGLYPDTQQKVHEELDQVWHDNSKIITQEDIKKLEYLECVMKEARRLFTPIPFTGRILEEDTVIGNFTIPKGTNCLINNTMLHRDPDVFPNPDVFDPDRFLNPPKRHPYAYIPFSTGPRNCIGQKYGMTEGLVLVASVLRRFKVKSVLPIDKLFLNMEVSLQSENGLPMIFLNR